MRELLILPPHTLWPAWTDPPDPAEPDREKTFRNLAAYGYRFRRLDLSRQPFNPLARAHSMLAALDPLRAARVLLLHRHADVMACMESGAVFILLLRRLLGFRGRVVIYDVAVFGGSRLRDRLMRIVLKRADMLMVFGRSQVTGLLEAGAPPDRVRQVLTLTYPDFFVAAPDRPQGDVVAVGDDISRDYPTLQKASLGLGRRVVIRSRVVREDSAYPGVAVLSQSLDSVQYRDLLAGAVLFVLTLHDTNSAGGVTALLEAMASAKAVVVTESAGLADYVLDGETCRVVPCGDPVALHRAMSDLLGDAAERIRLGTNARRFVEEHCSPEANAAMLAGVLREVVATPR